jgi:hypothetical protein
MTKLEQVIDSLTLEQAHHWDCEGEKWMYIDDMILAPNDLRATEHNVNAIENHFELMLTQGVSK